MTNHTPAPWNDLDFYGNIWHEDGRTSIPVVQGSGDGVAIKDADRDLILAAPDMYEALVDAKRLMEMNGLCDYSSRNVYGTICNALKKARGEV